MKARLTTCLGEQDDDKMAGWGGGHGGWGGIVVGAGRRVQEVKAALIASDVVKHDERPGGTLFYL